MRKLQLAMPAVILLAVVLAFSQAANAEEGIIGPSEVSTGENVVFSVDLGSNASYAYVYEWTVDNGTPEYGPSLSHVFNTTGFYNVTLVVKNVTTGQPVSGLTFSHMVEVSPDQSGMFLAVIGAGLAVGVSGMGAGIGVGIAGSAGAGALADRPKKFSKFFVFQALPQTQAIYGLLVAILIFLNTGLLTGGDAEVPFAAGMLYIGAGLAVGIAGLSAIGQGIAAGAGIGAYAEKDEMFTRGIIFSVMPETQAIYGLIISVLLIFIAGDPATFGSRPDAMGSALIGVGAGLAVGAAGLSAIGQGIAAASSIGAVSEKKEVFSRGVVFTVMPETQAIYGLLVGILLIFLGGLGGDSEVFNTLGRGFVAIGAGLAVGVAGLSAIGQGISAGAGISSFARNSDTFTRSLIFSAMSETFAIFGLLIAILAMLFAGFF